MNKKLNKEISARTTDDSSTKAEMPDIITVKNALVLYPIGKSFSLPK